MVFPGEMGYLGMMGSRAQLVSLAPLVLAVGGLSTPGGGRGLAHKWSALSWSTLASLEEVGMTTKEVQPITYVCQSKAQSSPQNTALPSETQTGCRVITMCMGQSIRILCKAQITTMCLVLCVMCPLDPL